MTPLELVPQRKITGRPKTRREGRRYNTGFRKDGEEGEGVDKLEVGQRF